MEEKVIQKTEEAIKRIVDEGLNTSNLDTLYKLSKIKHIAKEDSKMYGEYGNYSGREVGHGAYGDYRGYGDGYGRRGVDSRYKGHSHLDRMYDNYGRYESNRRRYGTDENTMKSLEYMLESAVDFFEMLKQDANTQEELNMVRKYAQKIAQM